MTPDYHFEVSKRNREEFENRRDYYKLHGVEIRLPANVVDRPMPELLQWHNAERVTRQRAGPSFLAVPISR